MPAMKVASCANGRRLTTRPFAGDDFQLLCLLNGAFRLVTLVCTIPVWVKIFDYRLHGEKLYDSGGRPTWCRDVEIDPWGLYMSPTSINSQPWVDAYTVTNDGADVDDVMKHQMRQMMVPFSLYLTVSLLYNILDIILSLAVWNAAAIGTPVEPGKREPALVSMVWIKIAFMNLLLLTVLSSGVYLTHSGRKYNYGCSPRNANAIEHYESSIWYGLFSAAMAVYAVELLMWPCVILNQVGHAISVLGREIPSLFSLRQFENDEGTCAMCIGCFIQCIRCLSCNKMGGGNIKAKNDLKDAAIAFMDFMNHEVNFDIVLSDIFVAFKLLDRKRREERYIWSKQAKMDKKQETNAELGRVEGAGGNGSNSASPTNVVSCAVNHSLKLERTLLSRSNESDMYLLRQGARYSQYAAGVYEDYPKALLNEGMLDGGWNGVYSPWKPGTPLSLSSAFRLAEFGFPSTALVYANFTNKVMATPYCILIDEAVRTVVIVVRGSVTLEDLVTDLQWSAIELNRVGERVGFDGRGRYCHRGILTNSKWIFNDVHRQKIISRVLRKDSSSPLSGYNLIITGHSLGGACAAVLATLFRPKYPNVKCYAFCPPGCTVSNNLATECDEFCTSFVVGNDIIPRMRGENIERLRYEFLEMLARIKVSKIAAFRDVRQPCRNKDLQVRNKRVLYARNDIPSTEYYQNLLSFRESRQRVFDELSPVETRLSVPGKVIHLVRFGDEANNKYLPYYKSRHFQEIHLAQDSFKEHSITNLVDVLESLVSEFETSSSRPHDDDDEEEEEEEYISVQSENSFGGDISEEPWFEMCSYPRGILASWIPIISAIAAVSCSVAGNNQCTLFSRQITGWDSNTESQEDYYNVTGRRFEPIGVSYGLYLYGVERFNEANEIFIANCEPYPSFAVNDNFVKSARAFSALALIIGFPIMFLLCLTPCMKFGARFLRVLSSFLMLVAICEALVFLFLSSARCLATPNPIEPIPLQSQLVWAKCTLGNGSKLAIVSVVMWCMASITLGCSSRLSLVESRLKKVRLDAYPCDDGY